MRVDTTLVLVITTGSCPITRAKEVMPIEGSLRVTATLSEVFDVAAGFAHRTFTIRAALTLHDIQLVPNTTPLLLRGAGIGPGVLSMLVVVQSSGGNWVAMQVVQVSAPRFQDRGETAA